MDENWNFSAVRSLIGLKLDGDIGLVSEISVHVLVSRFDCFLSAATMVLPALRDSCLLCVCVVVCRDGRKLQFLSRAQSN
jgi:hypothetical protein